jgi:hypothetical protein
MKPEKGIDTMRRITGQGTLRFFAPVIYSIDTAWPGENSYYDGYADSRFKDLR